MEMVQNTMYLIKGSLSSRSIRVATTIQQNTLESDLSLMSPTRPLRSYVGLAHQFCPFQNLHNGGQRAIVSDLDGHCVELTEKST